MAKRKSVDLDPLFLTMEQSAPDDPYRMLILAMIERAQEDAAGHVLYPGDQDPAQITAQARRWLHGPSLRDALTLAGYKDERWRRVILATLAHDTREDANMPETWKGRRRCE